MMMSHLALIHGIASSCNIQGPFKKKKSTIFKDLSKKKFNSTHNIQNVKLVYILYITDPVQCLPSSSPTRIPDPSLPNPPFPMAPKSATPLSHGGPSLAVGCM